jgi:ABC-type multidrug transport system fused ATPase/permease subunit
MNITSYKDLDEEKLRRVTQAVYLDEFIEQLPKGFETLYGDQGIDLSGGQKHRISLARALYKSPSVVILDEAMANIDAESESLIKRSLEEFVKDCTLFIIAHQFSTIQKVDRILVMNQGKVEAFGTHSELSAISPTYKSLYHHQIENQKSLQAKNT